MRIYLGYILENKWNWGLIVLGLILLIAQSYTLAMRLKGKSIVFVQHLNRVRQVCLVLAKCILLLGIGATMLSLMTLSSPAASATARTIGNPFFQEEFGVALSPALTGIIVYVVNLSANLILWFNCPDSGEGSVE